MEKNGVCSSAPSIPHQIWFEVIIIQVGKFFVLYCIHFFVNQHDLKPCKVDRAAIKD